MKINKKHILAGMLGGLMALGYRACIVFIHGKFHAAQRVPFRICLCKGEGKFLGYLYVLTQDENKAWFMYKLTDADKTPVDTIVNRPDGSSSIVNSIGISQ